jgi:hypothetical protein
MKIKTEINQKKNVRVFKDIKKAVQWIDKGSLL